MGAQQTQVREIVQQIKHFIQLEKKHLSCSAQEMRNYFCLDENKCSMNWLLLSFSKLEI